MGGGELFSTRKVESSCTPNVSKGKSQLFSSTIDSPYRSYSNLRSSRLARMRDAYFRKASANVELWRTLIDFFSAVVLSRKWSVKVSSVGSKLSSSS